MQINKIENTASFRAKIIRTQTFNKAIVAYKRSTTAETKNSFLNAIDFLNDDFMMKSYEINKINESPDVHQFTIKVLNLDGAKKLFYSQVFEEGEEGDCALQAIVDSFKELYGNRILQYVKLKNKYKNIDLNQKIDSIIKTNESRYK